MSSWAQQREAIRRAAQGGVRARTNAQGSQRLPLANNRLREVLLSRPNGELTRAGQFYYGLVGGRPPSRQFDEEQPLIREGLTDYILLRSGVKKAVRSLQPDGNYNLTKLGKSFFREKYTDWLAHVPVRITGTRQRGRNAGRPYQRDDFLPITVVNGSLSRQSSGLSDQQAHARVKEAALRQLDNPNDGDPILELSQEVYRYDATRDWAFSKQTLEVVDNRAQVQVSLRQPMGALREISYQLYNGSEILPSAFQARDDKLCVARQLAELLQLPLPEVLSDFDAICDKGWEQRGITALEIREFCAWRGAPMFFVSCRGELLDAYQPPVKENRAVAFTCYQAHAYFYKSARAVSHCDDVPRNEGLYRGDRKASTVPPFSEWRPWAGRIESGHFWAEDLRQVRAALLAQGHQPKVTMRSLCDWRALRLRVKDAPDCVVTQYPEEVRADRGAGQVPGREEAGRNARVQGLAGVGGRGRQRPLLRRGPGAGWEGAPGRGALPEGGHAEHERVAVPAAEGAGPRGLRHLRLPRRPGRAAGLDAAARAPLLRAASGGRGERGLPSPSQGPPRSAWISASPARGAGPSVQAVRCPHHRNHVRVGPHRSRAPVFRRAGPESPGPVPRVPPEQNGLGVLTRHDTGVALQPAGLRAVRGIAPTPAARLQAQQPQAGPRLPRNRRGPVPQERPGPCQVPGAHLLPQGQRGASPRGAPGGPHLRPAVAYMLEKGLATWRDFVYSLDATAHVDQDSVTQALQQMEAAWPEGEEHYAKLSVNALIGLWARNMNLIYTMRTSNHQFDGSGCQHRELFLDAVGGMHWDHIYVTQLLSNRSCRPVHDFVMASEHVAVSRIRDALATVPSRYLKAVKTDCVVFQDLPKKFQGLVDGLVRQKHPDGTPVYRCEEVKGLEGQYRISRIEAECMCNIDTWNRGGPGAPLPRGWEPAADRLPGHRENLSGAPDRDRAPGSGTRRPCAPSSSSRRRSPGPRRSWASRSSTRS